MTGSSELKQQFGALKGKAVDQFSALAIEGGQRALIDADNPLRLNFFATSMRILFEHIMDSRAPLDEVKKCSWFKPERENGEPTRWQRVVFAIQGGLEESFVRDELRVDLPPLRQRLLKAIDELSKHVHGRENTIIRVKAEQEVVASRTAAAMAEFLDTMKECREAVLMPIMEALDTAAIDALLGETILAVDELATHHSIEEIYVDYTGVKAIGACAITYHAKGTISVVLQWGSNSDLRRGDGAELGQDFPFECEFEVPLDDPRNLDFVEPVYMVDTTGWTGTMEQDDRD